MKEMDSAIIGCLFALFIALIYGAYHVDEKVFNEISLPVWPTAAAGVPMERWGSGIR